ncbi:MAG: 50S ribosomal protein L6 [Magnetospirillum sp. WYHS-4]
MSRIGKHPVKIPGGVTVEVRGNTVAVKGKQGELAHAFNDDVEITSGSGEVIVKPRTDSLRSRKMWGTARAVIGNMVKGVNDGFTRNLDINGVGYRAAMQGKDLVLQLGYSHEVRYPVPAGLTIVCPDQTHIVIKGADKQKVGQAAAEIRSYRGPEPYKGKGIKYDDETILRKEGKKK